MGSFLKLGVNIDHVATLRQARRTDEPDPVAMAWLAEEAGADGITVHLREDRRHIQPRDVERLRESLRVALNLEMGVSEEIVAFASRVRPACACLVPEKREEVTTEGGLDVAGAKEKIARAVERLRAAGIRVSLFIDPEPVQIEAAAETGAEYVELHTGRYANAGTGEALARELLAVAEGCRRASGAGLGVNAGHGLTYRNVQPVAALPELDELNIGHSVIARAVASGLREAVAEMKRLMREARPG